MSLNVLRPEVLKSFDPNMQSVLQAFVDDSDRPQVLPKKIHPDEFYHAADTAKNTCLSRYNDRDWRSRYISITSANIIKVILDRVFREPIVKESRQLYNRPTTLKKLKEEGKLYAFTFPASSLPEEKVRKYFISVPKTPFKDGSPALAIFVRKSTVETRGKDCERWFDGDEENVPPFGTLRDFIFRVNNIFQKYYWPEYQCLKLAEAEGKVCVRRATTDVKTDVSLGIVLKVLSEMKKYGFDPAFTRVYIPRVRTDHCIDYLEMVRRMMIGNYKKLDSPWRSKVW